MEWFWDWGKYVPGPSPVFLPCVTIEILEVTLYLMPAYGTRRKGNVERGAFWEGKHTDKLARCLSRASVGWLAVYTAIDLSPCPHFTFLRHSFCWQLYLNMTLVLEMGARKTFPCISQVTDLSSICCLWFFLSLKPLWLSFLAVDL